MARNGYICTKDIKSMEFEALIEGKERKRPIIIAGPCSAENEQQVHSTAQALAREGMTDLFRAGIWKPRTRPGAFEGAGKDALHWVSDAARASGLPAAIEVGSPKHVEAALECDIRYFWLGARTVVNPFIVQEIAEAFKGVNAGIMVKNPVNPDINLWIGALERLSSIGITRLAAIHRGFSHFQSAPLRNKPLWEIPITLKQRFKNLSVFTDPSHICGHPAYLQQIAQKALDLEMDGLMIETHICPAEALTDAGQQITPKQLTRLLQSLIIRTATGEASFEMELNKWRDLIDEKDQEILNLLASRFAAIQAIGMLKQKHQVTILQLDRWSRIIETRMAEATRFSINPLFMKRLLDLIHEESIRIQEEILNDDPAEN